jgi:hypothetical protein
MLCSSRFWEAVALPPPAASELRRVYEQRFEQNYGKLVVELARCRMGRSEKIGNGCRGSIVGSGIDLENAEEQSVEVHYRIRL